MPPAAFDDPAALAAAADALPQPGRLALEALLLAHGPGATVPPAAADLLAQAGEALWLSGALLPRVQPSPGAVLDPRQFAARCRINPALTRVVPLADGRLDAPLLPLPAAPSAAWDAVVVAARVEAEPPRATQTGALRKDDRRRLLAALGPDPVRWSRALALARHTRLVMPDGERMIGRPEARGRALGDPTAVLPDPRTQWAARLLLRLAAPRWRRLEDVAEALTGPLAYVAQAAGLALPAGAVGALLADALAHLHALGALDRAALEGGAAFRAPGEPPPRAAGLMVTSDLDVLVAPGEVDRRAYGRLARLAPYQEGDQVYRHRLSEAGLRLDQVAGGDDPVAWLEAHARYGLPDVVRATLRSWLRSAGRVVLWTHAAVVEEGGRFHRLDGPPPPEARVVDNGRDAPARLEADGDLLMVPFGADPLRLRAAVGRIGRPLAPAAQAWRWQLAPAEIEDPAALLGELEAVAGPLPGAVRAVARAGEARGVPPAREAVLLPVPRRLRAALLDDPAFGRLAREVPGLGALVLLAEDLPAAQERLDALGVPLRLRPEGPTPPG